MWMRIFALVVLGGGLVFVLLSSVFGQREVELRVVFFDVGQGDSIFIESPTGVQVLVDAGAGSDVLRALGREIGFFDREIDLVIATHSDKDHIGGFPDVFERYEIGRVLLTENKSETSAARAFSDVIAYEGASVAHARTGMRFDLGGGAVLEILFPDRDTTGWESNTSSIIARVAYGNTSFLLTGDAPQSIENYLVLLDQTDGVNNLKSTILKVGHHGSRTSTSEQFLEWINPDYAVISAAKDNRYGHPHKEVIELLHSDGVVVASTAVNGTVVFTSDGHSVEQK